MQKDSLEQLNIFFNDYSKFIAGSFFENNIPDIIELAMKTKNIIEKYDLVYSSESVPRFDALNPDYEKKTIPLSGVESLELVRNFIKAELPVNYLTDFDTYLKNGNIDFCDAEDDYYFAPPRSSISGIITKEEVIRNIEITLRHDYWDPALIIHEFMHQQNINMKNPLYNRERYLLTESVSIYFESLMFRYMEEHGYDKKEIAKVMRRRINDTFVACQRLINEGVLLDTYQKLGPLHKNSWKEREDLKLSPNWSSEKFYLTVVNNVASNIAEINPLKSSSYLFGTIIAYNAINSKDENIKDKMLLYNDSILTNEHIFTSLKLINIDLEDEFVLNNLLDTLKKEVVRVNTNYQGNTPIKK